MYNRRKGINPIVLIFIFALVAVCLTLVVFLVLGYRYKTTDKGYTFFGKVENGQPVTGTIRLPNGLTAELDYFSDTIRYSNGDVYTGDIEDIYRHGSGVMNFNTTGDVYEGAFSEDTLTGYGKYYYANGDIYEGYLSNGSKEGTGIYTWASWTDDSKQEREVTAVYDGAFRNGLANGNGVFEWKTDGSRYEGSFADGVKEGSGKFYFSNGDYYEGGFSDDKRSGSGYYRWANGETYTGNFINNYMDTRTVNTDGSFITNADGSFVHGSKATYTWPDGRTYTGYFENGRIIVVDDTDVPDISDPEDQPDTSDDGTDTSAAAE